MQKLTENLVPSESDVGTQKSLFTLKVYLCCVFLPYPILFKAFLILKNISLLCMCAIQHFWCLLVLSKPCMREKIGLCCRKFLTQFAVYVVDCSVVLVLLLFFPDNHAKLQQTAAKSNISKGDQSRLKQLHASGAVSLNFSAHVPRIALALIGRLYSDYYKKSFLIYGKLFAFRLWLLMKSGFLWE